MASITRTAQAEWQGTGKEGKGALMTKSGVLSATPYGFNTRFGDQKGTKPEALIASGTCGGALPWRLPSPSSAGFTATRLGVSVAVTLEPEGAGFRISKSALNEANVPGIARSVPEPRRGRHRRLPRVEAARESRVKAEITLDWQLG
jgi:lipoyl-dependent peroxiredoxin